MPRALPVELHKIIPNKKIRRIMQDKASLLENAEQFIKAFFFKPGERPQFARVEPYAITSGAFVDLRRLVVDFEKHRDFHSNEIIFRPSLGLQGSDRESE